MTHSGIRSLLVKGLLGFVAGFCVATLLFSLYGLPAPELARAFLQWPFISLIIASLLLLVFADSIRNLLGRGEIKIKWGENEIALNEIADMKAHPDILKHSAGRGTDLVRLTDNASLEYDAKIRH